MTDLEALDKLVVTLDGTDLLVDANALRTNIRDQVRFWRLAEVEPGRWRHPASGESGSLGECLRFIAAVYSEPVETNR